MSLIQIKIQNMNKNYPKIPVEISARHIHLSQKDLESLFGKGYQLKILRKLQSTNQFAAEETLDIQVGLKKISGVRIVGPVRKQTQVELSLTDAIYLGLAVPFKESGDLKNTPGATLINAQRKIKLSKGIIIMLRHIHCNPEEAKRLNLKQGEIVSVEIKGKRALVFNKVKVRVGDKWKLCLHLDTDEGNAAGMVKKGVGYLIK